MTYDAHCRATFWCRLVAIYAIIIIAFALLAGCSTTQTPEPRIIMQEVVVPGPPVPCVPATVQPAPDYPDTDGALLGAPNAAVRYQLMDAGRKLRNARLAEIEPVVASCAKATK